MTILVSVLAALIGGILYIVCTNLNFKELGRLTFFCGLLAFLLQVAPTAINLFGR